MTPVKLHEHMGMMMRRGGGGGGGGGMMGAHHVVKELEGIQQLCQGVIGLLPKVAILSWQQVL